MAATYEPIASTTLGSGASTVTFSSIPASWTDLILVSEMLPSGNIDMLATLNNDSGSNYSNTRLLGNGSAASSGRSSNFTALVASLNGVAVSSTTRVVSVMQFMSYSDTNVYKTILHAGSAAGSGVQRSVNLWRSSAVIDRVDLLAISGTFQAGSTFSLYGIKAA